MNSQKTESFFSNFTTKYGQFKENIMTLSAFISNNVNFLKLLHPLIGEYFCQIVVYREVRLSVGYTLTQIQIL